VHKYDIAAIVSQLAGLSLLASDATFQTSLTTLFGTEGPKIVAGIGLISLLASTVLRIIGSPSSTQGATK
jgi:hypothetical protein